MYIIGKSSCPIDFASILTLSFLHPQMPKLEFRSNAKPSQFAYPPPLEDKKEKTKEKVLTAVLSITAKQKKKEAEKKKDEEKMDVVGQLKGQKAKANVKGQEHNSRFAFHFSTPLSFSMNLS